MVEQSGALKMTDQDVLEDNHQEAIQKDQEIENNEEKPETQELDDNTETPVDEQEGREEKFDPKAFVKIDDPAVQAKFNDLYKQTKMSDARNQVLTKFLMEQQKQLDEFKARFNQTDHAEAARILNARLKDARDAGDDVAVDRIQQEIIDFRVDMKLNELKPKLQQKQQVQQDPDEIYVDRLAEEKDASGNYVRPWMDEANPEHQRALKVATFISQKFESEYGYRDVPEIMKRIDAVMAKKPTQQKSSNNRSPDPFQGGNLTNRRTDPKLKLSDAEKEIARKLGLSEKDYLANK